MEFTGNLDLSPFVKIIDRNSKPLVLANLHMSLKDNELTLKGANGQAACKSTQVVDGHVDGECLVDYYTLKKLNLGVANYVADNKLIITAEGVITLPLTDVQLYPIIPANKVLDTLAVPSGFDTAIKNLAVVATNTVQFDGCNLVALGGTVNSAARVLIYNLGIDFGQFNLDIKALTGISNPTKLHNTGNSSIFIETATYMLQHVVDDMIPYKKLLVDMSINFQVDMLATLTQIKGLSDKVTIKIDDAVFLSCDDELGAFETTLDGATTGIGSGIYLVDHVIAGIKMGATEYFMNDNFLMMTGDNFKYIVVGYHGD